MSGKKYYKQHQNIEQKNRLSFPQDLYNDVVVDEHTLVSIVIPCYNQAHFLKEAIESVLSQTYKNAEVIVVDDGSTDNTQLVCNSYNNIKYVRVERVGLSAARNIGVQFSKGDFIIFLDADDYLYPGAVEINLYFFQCIKKLLSFLVSLIRLMKRDVIYTQLLLSLNQTSSTFRCCREIT